MLEKREDSRTCSTFYYRSSRGGGGGGVKGVEGVEGVEGWRGGGVEGWRGGGVEGWRGAGGGAEGLARGAWTEDLLKSISGLLWSMINPICQLNIFLTSCAG